MRAAIRTCLLTCLLTALLAVPGAGLAKDLAVIFANPVYTRFADPTGVREVIGLTEDFARAGFDVEVVEGTSRGASPAQVEALWQQLKGSDRLVLVFAGHVLNTRDQTWLLHSDGGPMTALTIGAQAVPIQPFFDLLKTRPGDAMMVIADAEAPIKKGVGVVDAPQVGRLPQGVTLVQGAALPVAQFMATEVLRPGRTLHAAARNAPEGVRMFGFLSRGVGLVPEDATAVVTPEAPPTPEALARRAEDALKLSRDQRRAVQRGLTLLGFDTRGVDGILGRNSRSAIAAWQRSVGVPAYGYLSANQIARLEAAAAQRADELRREAEARRAEKEALDRAFWAQTGAGANEEGLRRYLGRYPDGLFSREASEALRAIERQRRREAQEAERLAWDKAVMLGTLDSYQDYLGTYPTGYFADEARARVASLRQPEVPRAQIEAAKAEEQRIGLTAITRTLIERQLRALNLDPGRADGKFTRDTRRALRQFQRINNVAPTGYVTRQTVVLLLASAAQ